MPELDRLKSDIDELVPDMVATRRDLHEHPELAFEEVRTSNIVAQRLRALGLEVQTGVAKTGVVGLLRGGTGKDGGKTIAIRADMEDRKSTRLNSSHEWISYAVFCLKKKKKKTKTYNSRDSTNTTKH